MELERWIDRYVDAWERADDDLLVLLFTETASDRSSPFRDLLEDRNRTPGTPRSVRRLGPLTASWP